MTTASPFLAEEVIQPDSIFSKAVEQGRLLLARAPKGGEVSLDVIAKRKDLLSAINLCIDVSGVEDKEIYLALGIDPGHWSNIRKGKKGCYFPTNKLDDLMTMCGNEIPLIWQALKRGKGLHLLQTEAEKQLHAERDRRIEAENKLAYAESLLKR